MDLDALKGKTIDDQLHAQLVAYVSDIGAAKTAAQNEAIRLRKGRDDKVLEAKRVIQAQLDHASAICEHFGVEPDADLGSLPDAKAGADSNRQTELQLKKLTRERDALQRENVDLKKSSADLNERITSEKRNALLATSAGKHGFIDATVAQTLAGARVVQEGDDFLFRTDDGKLVPVDEGFAWMAKSMPFLVKPAGTGGSGGGASGGGGFTGVPGSGGQPQKNPFHPKTFNLTEQIAMRRDNPQLADQLKAAAAAAT